MIRFQPPAGHAATQTSVAVKPSLERRILQRKVSVARILCRPAFAAVIGLRGLHFLCIVLCPLLATRDHLITIAFVVLALVAGNAPAVVRRPALLVLGYLFFVFLLVLPSCLDPMR